ncbi:MAG: hypothetical protein QOD03_1769 [Verrucomicrobiota bacterium]
MKTSFFSCLVIALGLTTARVQAQFSIYGFSSPGFFYNVTNIPAGTSTTNENPTLNLTAGATYRFIIGVSSIHPVVIATNNTANPPSGSAYSGATPQIVTSGSIVVTLPTNNYPSTLYYRCNFHLFNGLINILPPPAPNQILSVSVTTNIVLLSTGETNTWLLVPEFSSNLVSGVWAPVSSYTNSFLNGTNTTQFNLLDPICGPNVFLRLRQHSPG